MKSVPTSHANRQSSFCPNPEFLRRASLGELDHSEMEWMAEHLSDCSKCCQVIENFVQTESQFVPLQDWTQTGFPHQATPVGNPVPPAISVATPKAFGTEFQVIRQLGRGGSGDVFECFDKRLKRSVAIKVLRADHFTPQQIRRIQHEASLQAKINHPNFVQIFEVGESAGMPYISMELVEGGSVSDQIAERPLSPRIAARLLADIAQAIDYAHQQNLIHRDLKPSNILLTRGILADAPAGSAVPSMTPIPIAIPKIADFGLAKVIGETSEFSQPDVVAGTPAYIAPEQISGKQSAQSPASDIYSLGVILYECLTGTRPFQADTVAQTLAMIETALPVSPRLLQPGVNRDLETICLKCLSKDPRHRYPTALAMSEDLRRFLEGRTITARPTPAVTRLLRWSRRNRALAAAIVGSIVLAVLLVISSLIFAWEQQRLKQIAEDKTIKAMAEEQRALESEAKAISLRDKSIVFYNKYIPGVFHFAFSLMKLEQTELTPEKLQSLRMSAYGIVDSLRVLFFTDPELVEASPKLAIELLYRMTQFQREVGDIQSAVKGNLQTLEIYRRNPSDYSRQHLLYIDTLNHLGTHFLNIGEKDAGVDWLKQGWEICCDIPPRIYLEDKDFESVMLLITCNYVSALKLSGLEEAAANVLVEVEQLKKRIADVRADKNE